MPRRLLVTYDGKGTEWLPDEAVDRAAYTKGEPNELIVKDPSSKRFIDEWDIAVFKGGNGGLLHRTPDEALASPSVFMRLDNINFGPDTRYAVINRDCCLVICLEASLSFLPYEGSLSVA